MRDAEPNWEWYRTFLQVLDTGSLSAAGRAMGIAQPTVGRHIEGLETALGLTLFTRSVDGYAPTDAARELAPHAAGVAASAAALRRAASGQGDGVRGTVRLTASEVIGVEVLPPILVALREAHPALSIELVLSNRVDDLLHREADIAVRMFRPEQDALVARHAGTVEIGLHAHERYLARCGTPRTLAELKRHTVIGYDRETAFTRAVGGIFAPLGRDDFAFSADSDLAQLAALRAGFGIGFCQTGLAARDPALRRVLRRTVSMPLQAWVAMHEDLRRSARCMAAFTALADGLAAYARGARA